MPLCLAFHSAKIRLKKMIVIIIVIRMNESQELMVFGNPRIDFHYETKARKVMVDFKFDAYFDPYHYSKSS